MPRSAEASALPRRPARLLAGTAVAAAIAAMIGVLFWSVLHAVTSRSSAAPPDVIALLGITALQASLSTIFSLPIGIALAWALNRLRFPGRGLVVGLFASAIVTPGLVVAFGLIDVWGRSGWFGGLGVPIFGLGGVVAAHIILDGAFAARVLLARLDAVPERLLKTGHSLALAPWTRFSVIDWPALRGSLPGLAAIIFLLSFTSFPVVLLLGGGPAVQTLEVAIYAAVRLDFDLAAAVHLALVQVAVCSVVILISAGLAPVPSSLDASLQPRWRDRPAARLLQWAVLLLGLLGFAAPLLAVLLDGIRGLANVAAQAAFWSALGTSVGIGAASAVTALLLAFAVAGARATVAIRSARLALGAPAYAYLAVPAVTLSLGAFLLVRDWGIKPEAAAPLVVIVANALLSLPFALATLAPPLEAIARKRGKLIRSLGLSGWRQFSAVEWPLIARDVGLALALGFCFSLGDLGVIALFGTQDFATLPLLMFRALGAYRSHDAAAIAALMLLGTIVAFTALPKLFERLGRAGA